MSTVIYLQNALTPQNRQVLAVAPASIRTFAPDWPTPHLALLDGRPVLRADWDRVIEDGQALAFVDVHALPQGGGGGSNPLRTIAILAVMVAAPQLAAAWVGASSGMAYTAATIGFNMVGQALVNAIIPPPKPPSTQQAAALAAPSPTYSLQAQGNTARLEAAIPEHFGRLMAYPDYGAQPYVEFSGNEQYLYQLLVIGRGEYDLEAIRIEDTPIASFDEISYEVIAPGGALTLFPSAVTTSTEVSGQTLQCRAATYSQTGTVLTVTLTGHGLAVGKLVYLDFTSGTAADGTYTVATAPTADTFTVVAASATTSGNVTASPWLGGFIANASGSSANYLGFDFVMGRGLYQVNTGTGALLNVSITLALEYRPVDLSGLPTGAGTWLTLGGPTYTAATTTPQRYSERYNVTAGRYEVRARRVDIEQTDTSYGHNAAWAGLRAYLPESRNFGDVTLLAMRLRASNSLSLQASRKVNVIATRKLPVWNGSSWSANTATRSIAWPFAYAAKQIGLTDAQIDLSSLLALSATWAARGDTFDGRFDNFLGFWEAVTKIASTGRAKPFMQGGVLRCVRDQAQTVPVCMFSMRNTVPGSFSIDYLMPTAETADAVNVAYFDSGSWASARVQASLPGSTAAKPAKIDLFGVVNRDQAFREGMYQAACNRYRRKIIRLTTEMEGFIPSFGDLVTIQHDMPGWGQGGDVVAWNAGTLTLTLSEPAVFTTGNHYIGLRTRAGGISGPYLCTAGATAYQVVLAVAPSSTPYTGQSEERTHFSFGPGEAWRQRALLVSAKPQGLTKVVIECINEDDNVHTAESGVTTPVQSSSTLANYTNAPTISGLSARSMPNAPEKMLITWLPSTWASYYVIEQSSDGQRWTRTGQSETSNYTAVALYGNATLVRVAAVGIAKGPWVQVAYGSSADYMWNAADTTLMWNATSTTLMWRY